jgi:hypothetical protein
MSASEVAPEVAPEAMRQAVGADYRVAAVEVVEEVAVVVMGAV